ncbi:MAG: 50S ribosomal protein L10 [Selenomonadaceae bacterium]|nr:50S ribosomal protein L10 [Selenomonadaceae bacterium]MBP3723261.1 50S ribosomal protein L10 [Selenomonadaceae bacterium]
MAVTSKVTPKKEAIVKELKDQMTSSKGVVITSYRGLTVANDTKLRRALREAGVHYHVVKNTMMRIAAKDAGLEEIAEHLEGTTAMAYSEDAVAPAKVICDFIKKNKLDEANILSVKVGLVEGKVIDEKEVKALASLPSREELIAKMLGSMNAPITNTVGVLSGVLRNFVYALEAVRAKKESA